MSDARVRQLMACTPGLLVGASSPAGLAFRRPQRAEPVKEGTLWGVALTGEHGVAPSSAGLAGMRQTTGGGGSQPSELAFLAPTVPSPLRSRFALLPLDGRKARRRRATSCTGRSRAESAEPSITHSPTYIPTKGGMPCRIH